MLGCEDCTFQRKRLSREDQEVIKRIEADMKIDNDSGTIHGRYPWKPCVSCMSSNYQQAEKIQASIEKHMLRAGTHQDYLDEMEKAIKEGKVRELMENEMTVWHGPVNYITTFAVLKPGSVSTKTRIVSNSALKNNVSRLSVNDCLWPGPNTLADLLVCLVFWCAVEMAIMMDLRKAYQAIHTSSTELHLRRFLYRRHPREMWRILAYTRANFGDLAAGLMLEVAKRRVANKGKHIDPMAVKQIKDYTFVDNSILGGNQEDVDRMRGDRVGESYTGTVPQILA